MMIRRIVCLLLVIAAFAAGAEADTIYMDGTAKAVCTETVLAPIGGTVKSIDVRVGDSVTAGTPLMTLKTVVTYADQPGRVAFYGRPGERSEAVTDLYGAVAVIEPDSRYRIETSTLNAYDSNENKMVRSGIMVYLSETEGAPRETGIGQVYDVDGRNFKVRVLQGNFELGDTVNIYQTENHDYTTRIGRGDIQRTDAILYTGEGSIVSLLAEDGAHVEKGDPLFETLDGTFDGLTSTGNTIPATTEGIVSRIAIEQGDHLDNRQTVAEIWPVDSMRMVASVQESDLNVVNAGDAVEIEFDAFPGNWIKGTVEKIASSALSEENSKTAEYEVIIAFETELPIRFGMHAQVRTEQ